MTEGREGSAVWHWQGTELVAGVTRRGTGPVALLLPALSSISTRAEMAPVADRLASRYATVAVDWPGFGTGPKPATAWSPAALAAFLRFALDDLAPSATLVVAAGHAAGYLLAEAAARPAPGRRLALVAPTWRGPLPTMLRRRTPWFGRLARAADVPVLGAALYRLNVNPLMVGVMARAHVYADPGWLRGARLAGKTAVTGGRGARHAALRFVTGELDPFPDRAAALDAARALAEPAIVIYGAEAPAKSRADMEALAAIPGIASTVLPHGKLGLHEEFPEAVAAAILAFCGGVEGFNGSPEPRADTPAPGR